MKSKKYSLSFLLAVAFLCCQSISAFAQSASDDFLNDLINLWNNKKFEKVYQPLKEYKASKKITGDFEIDYMIASSACRSGADAKEVKSLVENLLKDYSFSKEDAAYIKIQETPTKYTAGSNARMDEERISNRGKIDEPTSKEVPKPLGKGTGKIEEEVKPVIGKDGKEIKTAPVKTPGAATAGGGDGKCADIIRRPNVTQIVKGDQVITVKQGWAYFVRGDSIYAIPPPTSLIKVVKK